MTATAAVFDISHARAVRKGTQRTGRKEIDPRRLRGSRQSPQGRNAWLKDFPRAMRHIGGFDLLYSGIYGKGKNAVFSGLFASDPGDGTYNVFQAIARARDYALKFHPDTVVVTAHAIDRLIQFFQRSAGIDTARKALHLTTEACIVTTAALTKHQMVVGREYLVGFTGGALVIVIGKDPKDESLVATAVTALRDSDLWGKQTVGEAKMVDIS
jgi:hypothetical protein